jgi:hypothetical protein
MVWPDDAPDRLQTSFEAGLRPLADGLQKPCSQKRLDQIQE